MVEVQEKLARLRERLESCARALNQSIVEAHAGGVAVMVVVVEAESAEYEQIELDFPDTRDLM